MKTIQVIEISINVNEPIDLSSEFLASGCLKMLRYRLENVTIFITPHKSKTRETSFLEEKAFLVER